MDLLETPNYLGLNSSKHLPIFSKSLNLPPHIILDCGNVTSSVIADGSIIGGKIHHSTIAYQVEVDRESTIEDCVILPNVKIGKQVHLRNVIVNKETIIPDNYRLTAEKLTLITQDNLFEVGDVYE
jgi:glucose-1-phosphate adenylyltransferase